MGEAKGRSIECGAGAISLCEAVVMALHRVERAVGALHPIEKTAKYYYGNWHGSSDLLLEVTLCSEQTTRGGVG